METYIVNEKAIELPTSWVECTFERFLKFSEISDRISSKETREILTDADEWQQTLDDLKDNTQVLSFWCNLPESEISLLDLDVATEIMNKLKFLGEEYLPISIDSFTIGDEKFYLPKKLMAKSSFGRYIEAEQLEIQANMLKEGVLSVLPRQVAILCKKEGEEDKLDDALIDKRAKQFEKLDMATIWDVGFFLGRLEQKLMLDFLISQKVQEEKKSLSQE